jgi:hypothetical protein
MGYRYHFFTPPVQVILPEIGLSLILRSYQWNNFIMKNRWQYQDESRTMDTEIYVVWCNLCTYSASLAEFSHGG